MAIDWQPIETAAKEDGVDILLSTNGDGVHVGHWNVAFGCFMDDYGAPFGWDHDGSKLSTASWIEASFWAPINEPLYGA